jgi:hypothetical protein
VALEIERKAVGEWNASAIDLQKGDEISERRKMEDMVVDM